MPQQDGATLMYGPYEDVKPYTSDMITITFESPKPLAKAVKLERDIWVSHWGATASFEERYDLQNFGTRLTGNSFSRMEYNKRAEKYNLNIASLKRLDFVLPPFVRDPYYTDLVGNVSTSHFRRDESLSLLQVRPRFPVFGGWHYNFTLGWNADLKHFVKMIAPERYLLKLPLVDGPGDVSYNQVTINIMLPEGAQ